MSLVPPPVPGVLPVISVAPSLLVGVVTVGVVRVTAVDIMVGVVPVGCVGGAVGPVALVVVTGLTITSHLGPT